MSDLNLQGIGIVKINGIVNLKITCINEMNELHSIYYKMPSLERAAEVFETMVNG